MDKQGFGKTLSEIDFVALKKGRHQGFIAAYNLYADHIYSLAMHIIANGDTSSDILQQVFETLLNKSSTLKSEETLGPWLKQCTINACLGYFRKEKRQDVFIENLQHTVTEQDGIEHQTAISSFSKHEATEMNALLERLPPTSRSVVYLHSMQELKHCEIAPSLDIKESNSRQLYSRALKQLKSWLK